MKINSFYSVSLAIINLFFWLPLPVNASKTNLLILADMKNHSHTSSGENHHHHKKLDISQNESIPQVELQALPDSMKGWNLHIKTTNFNFNPSKVNQDSNANEGHGHLYINGQKITRIYGNWYHLPELPSGEVQIKVTLNTNLHEDLIYQGQVISDSVMINNPKN